MAHARRGLSAMLSAERSSFPAAC
ncbi:hypothetical protein PSEUDO9AZ_11244 [Pseudomonas sp. 9AZ]|nr:hypothetical protein PSEUDO9AZ_11244 [Pseudomonas sp. 9AZ]